MNNIVALVVLLYGIFVSVSVAQPVNQLIGEQVQAKRLNFERPKFPVGAAKAGREGWVNLSYVIESDGSVTAVIIEDSSGSSDFERAAISAVKSWQYSPAVLNGKAVQQCNTSVRMNFALYQEPRVSEKFSQRYKTIDKLLTANELEEAKVKLDKLAKRRQWTLAEDTWFELLNESYSRRIGDKKSQLASLIKIKTAPSNVVSQELKAQMLIRLYLLNVEFNYLAYAVDSYQELESLIGEQNINPGLKAMHQQVKQFAASEKNIIVSGEITTKDYWRHKLLHHEFSLVEHEGKVHKVELRCSNKRFAYNFDQQSKWSIPDKFGQCYLYIYGETNAQFDVVEHNVTM